MRVPREATTAEDLAARIEELTHEAEEIHRDVQRALAELAAGERWEDELEGGVGRSVVCYLLEHDLAESVRPGYLALSDAGWCRYLEVTDPLLSGSALPA